MKYLFFFLLIFFSSNIQAANEGKGFIDLSKACVSELNSYFNYEKTEKEYYFVFAAHKDGHCAWWGDPKGIKEAEKISLEHCADFGKGCKIFARGSKIVWEWDKLPNYYLGGRNQVSWKKVKILIGTGPIEFDRDTNEAFGDYIDGVKDVTGSKHYFAVSKDGLNYGMQYGEISESKLKKMAIAECMSISGDQCYLYAENDEIIWQE